MKRTMLRSTATTLSLLFAVTSFAAQEVDRKPISPEKQALLKELYTVTRLSAMTQNIVNTMLSQVQQDIPTLVSATHPEIVDQAEVTRVVHESTDRVTARFKKLLNEKVDFKTVSEQIFYPIYDKYFSEAELRDLIAFYKTPTGQKTLDVLPQVVAEALERSNKLMMPQLMQIMTQAIDEEKGELTKPIKK